MRWRRMVSAVQRLHPDVVLLDLLLPGQDPLDLLHEHGSSLNDAHVIVYSGLSDPEVIREAYAVGVSAYLDKLEDPPLVLEIIRRVAAGDVKIPRFT